VDSFWGRIPGLGSRSARLEPRRAEHILQIARFGFPTGARTVKKQGSEPGKSLWRVWNLPAKTGSLREDAHPAELVPPRAHQLASGRPGEPVQSLVQRLLEQRRGLLPVVLGPPGGLGDDRVDHA
jgi:hypothetical protein